MYATLKNILDNCYRNVFFYCIISICSTTTEKNEFFLTIIKYTIINTNSRWLLITVGLHTKKSNISNSKIYNNDNDL